MFLVAGGDEDETLILVHSCAGNEFFKQQKYPEAVKHYSEALRRNPKDPRVNSLFLLNCLSTAAV